MESCAIKVREFLCKLAALTPKFEKRQADIPVSASFLSLRAHSVAILLIALPNRTLETNTTGSSSPTKW